MSAPGFCLWRHSAGQNEVNSSASREISRNSILVILFTWLFAKPASSFKYVELYTNHSFDVLEISSKLSHFLWPSNSVRFSAEIFKVLRMYCADYKNFIIHAMSIGAFNYTTCIKQAAEKPIIDSLFISRIRCCVFDSLTLGSLNFMIQGIARGTTQSALVQQAITFICKFYFTVTKNVTQQSLFESVHFFRVHPVKVPTLIFGSENDPMSDILSLQALITEWKKEGKFPVTAQVWKESIHCGHMKSHPDQYIQLLNQFLAELKLDGGGSHEPSCLSKL